MSKDTDSVKSNKSTTSMRNARKKTEFLRKYLNENMSIDQSNMSIHNPDNQDNQDNPDNQKNTIEVSKEFQENVIKFVNIDDIIKKKEDELKILKKESKPHEEFVLNYLANLKEQKVDITGGCLKVNKSETKAALKSDHIKNVISKKFDNIDIVNSIIKEIEDSRQVTTKLKLNRSIQN